MKKYYVHVHVHVSRDGRAKSTQIRVIGIIADEMDPYIFFSSNRVSMINVHGCISSAPLQFIYLYLYNIIYKVGVALPDICYGGDFTPCACAGIT